MSHSYTLRFLFLFFCLIHAPLFSSSSQQEQEQQPHIMLPSQPTQKKLTTLHFYYHDILEGENPTVVQIIDPSNTPNSLGTTFMMDNALTEGPELSSKQVGRAQGMFGLASIQDRGMVMLINFAFSEEGEYKGSTLSMLGRNPVMDTVREMPIVGGTRLFRFASGFAIAKSLWSISTEQHFVVEYNITISLP
ncbi:hypothetical protein HN51_010731 [Arachis hypogaea]|uniref:Dirigent protein n=1 Tax=Arachis hypogaea TaxID=3818 RepID=A0A445E253_ARAHY|nr:dirigent protein 23 [Arachis hypogaea]QHO55869.1 Dirigent protein [Arachis hypogaea]RYR69499.1 hypothetical protein Ahy_A03g016056 [Arachis hypogaea]